MINIDELCLWVFQAPADMASSVFWRSKKDLERTEIWFIALVKQIYPADTITMDNPHIY